MDKNKRWLKEQLQTARNLCDISLLLLKDKQEVLLPTILELLLCEAQELVDEYCIAEGEVKDSNYTDVPDNTGT